MQERNRTISEYLPDDKPPPKKPTASYGSSRDDTVDAIRRLLTDLNDNIRAMPITTPSSYRQAHITEREILYNLLKLYQLENA